MNMWMYIARRVLAFIPTLLLLTILVFMMAWMLPHEYFILPLTAGFLGPTPHGPSYYYSIMKIYPSDPALTYLYYLEGLFTGNWGITASGFGVNFPFSGSVFTNIWFFVRISLVLIVVSAIISIFVARSLATYASRNTGSRLQQFLTLFSYSGFSAPAIWIAPLLMLIFGKGIGPYPLGIFPFSGIGINTYSLPSFISPSGLSSSPTGFIIIDALIAGDFPIFFSLLMHMVLPVATISYGLVASLLRFYMLSMDEEKYQEYVKAAKSRGVRERELFNRHIRRNATIKTMPQMGVVIANMILGLIVAENFFDYYGIGMLLFQSLLVPYLQIWALMAIIFILGLIVLVSSLLVDILLAYIDPKIRF